MKLAPTAMLRKSELPYALGSLLDKARSVLSTPLVPEHEAELTAMFAATQKQLRRYGFAVQNHHRRRGASLEYRLSTALGYRVISVIMGYPKKAAKIPFAKVKNLANAACPRIPSGETVHVRAMTKPEGGERLITIFGKVARANQSMARDMIQVACGHSKYEFARKGRGREKLMGAISNANRNGGVRALGTFDIKDCFPSMLRSAAEAVIPLSKGTIGNTLYIPVDTHIHNALHNSEIAVPAGLPQGALSSPIVASRIIEPCVDKVPARFRCSFLDNINFGDGSVEEVEALLDILSGTFESQYPGSPLFEKCRHAFKIGTPSDVLGYWPRPNPPWFGGGIRFSPSNKALRRFYIKLATELLQMPSELWAQSEEHMAYAFAASQKSWSGRTGGREMLITAFNQYIAPLLGPAHQQVLDAGANGFSKKALTVLARSQAAKVMPKVVVATENGLSDWHGA